MIHCKKHFIALGFTLMLPLISWSEAPVVDESDNFAMMDEQQAQESSVVHPKYDNPRVQIAQNDNYQDEDGPALAKNDELSSSNSASMTDNASLITKIQTLQQEVQELRGQLEVQAHDLKLLQQQQIAFYKDLDARLSGSAASGTSNMDLSVDSKDRAPRVSSPVVRSSPDKDQTSVTAPAVLVSRANPAEEQISYLAAYELVKNKRYDEALNSMNVFVQKYPKGGYTANAQYWLGELYLVKNDYENAVAHFNVVLQQFPTSSKSAASMLKVGYAYAAMGNKSEAKKYLEQVVRAYPDTPTAQLANSKLKSI